MPIRKRYLLPFFLILAASPALAAATFAPGQWNHETRLVQADVPGIPEWVIRMFAGHGSRKSCNSAVQLNSHPETLLTADDEAVCKLRTFSAANGKLVFDTFCTNKRFPDGLLVASRGSYTPTSYTISTTSTGMRNGKPVRILTTGTGKHVADACAKS
ncbi:DUF3617 family protein [Sphingomonas sp. CGMCC 1.13654]|uniref:DUF3617 family protein n=1 Tax=Sphingomonas chungangi TaxID=2683589 RepID=A0A838L5J0_9SPHN|nr:DUF3617 family protein [Sphingomonas chungangi]MBA2932878.1 DUF3617 family protein [Sphingomonas chungangi]MVW56498.1 DUF3617 family protein [Sphingomonas chungangi]